MRRLRVPLVIAAIVATEIALAIFFLDVPKTDFGAFYTSGAAFLAGQPLYAGDALRPNLNPPVVSVALFSPLAQLSMVIAARVWVAIGVVALVASLHLIKRELDLPLNAMVVIAALLLITVPARHVWEEGQITWLLLYPVTRAWVSYRNGHRSQAGLWLGPVIAAKPFLALIVMPLWSMDVLLAAGLGSVALTAVGVDIAGRHAWHDWVALSGKVQWLNQPQNASIWSVVARMVAPAPGATVGMSGVLPVIGIVAAGGMGLLVASLIARTPDRRWFAGSIFAVLVSPLGWVYYLPLALGPIVALWKARGLSIMARLAVAGLIVPMPIVLLLGRTSLMAAVTIGSLYTWAAIALFASVREGRLSADPQQQRHDDQEGHQQSSLEDVRPRRHLIKRYNEPALAKPRGSRFGELIRCEVIEA